MSFNNINTKLRSNRGFTIVELLIVIVVIGILAAITIVSYNGVTSKANTANAQSAAETAVKKIEAYNAENSGYPATFSLLTASGNSSNSSYIASGTYTLATAAFGSTAPSTSPATINIQKCITSSVITGMIVGYWNYSTNAQVAMPTGTTTGTCTYIAS